MMPRTKPSKTEETRVTLGTKERMLLEEFSTSYRLQATLPAIAAILSDATALYALGTIYEIVTGRDIPGLINPMEAAEFWDAIKEDIRTPQSSEDREANASSFVGGLGSLADMFFATISGSYLNQDINPDLSGIGGSQDG